MDRGSIGRFTPRRLTHVNLYVGDLHRSLAFYRDVCGVELAFEEPGIEAMFLSNGNSHHDLALMQASEREHVGRDGLVQVSAARGRFPGLNHIAFEIESEAALVRAIEGVQARGVVIDRMLDHLISRSAYLSDPDGNVVECYADSIEDWRAAYRDLADELITSQWTPDLATASDERLYEASPTYTTVADAPLHPRRTARAALAVADLDRSVAFYTDVIGLRVLRRNDVERTAVLGGSLDTPGLLLLEAGRTGRIGLHHIGLEVADDGTLGAGIARLDAAGIPVAHAIDRDDSRAVVVVDPDGLPVELFVAGTLPDASTVLTGTDREFVI